MGALIWLRQCKFGGTIEIYSLVAEWRNKGGCKEALHLKGGLNSWFREGLEGEGMPPSTACDSRCSSRSSKALRVHTGHTRSQLHATLLYLSEDQSEGRCMRSTVFTGVTISTGVT
eukprot:6957941-Pyramimonas_sp.AAC.2